MKIMSYQTHIDDFFKLKYKQTSYSATKAKQYLKSTMSSGNRKKKKTSTKPTDLDLESDCSIIYEKMCNNYLSNIKAVPNDTIDMEETILYKNEICLETSSKESENSLNVNQMLQNNSMELMKTQKKKRKRNSSLSPAKSLTSHNISYLKATPDKETKSPKRNNSVTDSNSSRNENTPKKFNYSPKVQSGKSLRNMCRPLFTDAINDTIKNQAIENMNLAKQGAIPYNNFNLEEIYSHGEFTYNYNHVNSRTSVKYELSEIVSPKELHSKILFYTIFTVFSNPMNCGYFDQNELDFIYSILTLPSDAQTLLARMIKRKRAWFRKSNINYPEIAPDLKSVFETLDSRSICTFNIENANLTTILELLQVDEIRQLCQAVKIKSNANKKSIICKLLKLSNTKSLFPGVKSPRSVLYSSVVSILDYCVSITDKTWNIIEKIITLIMPNQDPQTSIADIFFTLSDIYFEKVMFPSIPGNHFPVFSSNLHLISYIQAKRILSITLQYIEKKNWIEVERCGILAKDTLSNLIENESLRLKNSLLPGHVKRYMPEYIWLKILSTCIDAFKKNEGRMKTRTIEVLHFLLKQDLYIHTKKGQWYAELALIEMHYHKNLEASTSVIMKALRTDHLTQVDKVELIQRANKIVKKKTGLEPTTKANIIKVLEEHDHQMPKYKPLINDISATLMPESGVRNKSIWCIESNTKGQIYGSVEDLALYHYCEQGYSKGLHCEGALPIILFYTLFWEELYMHIPGTFVTPYQDAPNDLFTEQFYENRKDTIDTKLQIVSNLDSSELSTQMHDKFEVCKQFKSIMPSNLFKDSLQLKEIVYCLGVEGVVGICKRLIENFKLWKAGFPDLIVWNVDTKEHKIVEVKGPRDSLSTKQQLWLEYLNQLGLSTEVCLVRAK